MGSVPLPRMDRSRIARARHAAHAEDRRDGGRAHQAEPRPQDVAAGGVMRGRVAALRTREVMRALADPLELRGHRLSLVPGDRGPSRARAIRVPAYFWRTQSMK